MDLKLKDVASLLNISEGTLRRWANEGVVPAYRLNRQYRFNRTEIEDWLLRKKLGRGAKKERGELGLGELQFSLFRAMHHGVVLKHAVAQTKGELIHCCMREMASRFDLDADVLTDLFMDREHMMSTGLGYGIAVPHTRDFLLHTHFDVVSVVYPQEPLDYGSLDGEPVHTCFFLFASDDRRHLNLLSKIAHLSHTPAARHFLQQQPSKEDLLEYIKRWEGQLVATSASM